MFLKIKHVHFIGIGGIGMSGLAELLHNMGLQVSGSDAVESENTLHLRAAAPNINGNTISVTIGHHPDNIRSAASAGADGKGRGGDGERGRRGDEETYPCPPVPLSPCPLVPLSPSPLVPLSPSPLVPQSPLLQSPSAPSIGTACDAQPTPMAVEPAFQQGCVVVYSSAIRPDNPELVAARNSSVPVIPRAEILADLMRRKHGIAVAGTHGKTTTTSMISAILTHAGLDPTIVIGGRLASLAGIPCGSINARLGQGNFLVAEADESDGSFLKLSPTIAVVTTLDEEHMEYYGSLDKLKTAFLDFINKVPFYGAAVLCLDQENIRDLICGIRRRYISYGLDGTGSGCAQEYAHRHIGTEEKSFSPLPLCASAPLPLASAPLPLSFGCHRGGLQADLTATAIESAGLRSSFEVVAAGPDGENPLSVKVSTVNGQRSTVNVGPLPPSSSVKGHTIGQIVLNVPGIHNIYNSLAAIAVARELDIPFDIIREALASFQGADRRFQIKAHVNNTYVVDDYGHHPTEVKATLATAKGVLATEGTPGKYGEKSAGCEEKSASCVVRGAEQNNPPTNHSAQNIEG